MTKVGPGLILLFLVILLNGCATVIGDADIGPDPGGGFYDRPNVNVGQINPVHISPSYTIVGEAPR